MRVSIIAPGWGSVNLSKFTHHPTRFGYSYREGRGGPWNDFDPNPLVTFFFLVWGSEPTLAIWSERFARLQI